MGNHHDPLAGEDIVAYPAGFDKVIAVGASDIQDIIANFSVRGNHIDVAAPGVNILSTFTGGGYQNNDGTSMATPHVSGIASLLKGFNANLANDDIENIIRLSTDDLDNPGAGDGTNPGFDQSSGAGRVNAERALNFLQAPNQLFQWNTTSGTIHSTIDNYTQQFLSAPGIASGTYIVKRKEVRKTVIFPIAFCELLGVWGRGVGSTGWSQANPNYGEGHIEIVPGTASNTGVTLRTYVYEVFNILGQSVGHYPTTPGNVTFNYTALGVPVGPLSGPANVCIGGTTFTLSTVPAGASVTWQATPSNLFAVSSGSFTGAGTSHNISLAAAGSLTSGQGTLTVNITCGSVTQLTSAFWVGVPSITNPTVNTNPYYTNYPVCPGPNFLNVTPTGTNNIAEWTVPAGISYLEGYNLLDFTMPTSPSTITITAKAGNVCGNSKAYSFKLVKKTTGCGQAMMAAYPNPVADELVVTPSSTAENTVLEAALTDLNGLVVFTSQTAGSSSIRIPVKDYKNGRYILTITENGVVEKQHILISH